MGKPKIDTELAGFADDFRFRESDQRRVNLKARAFGTGFRSDIGQRLECLDELRPAIGIAAKIDCIYTKENVVRRNHFRPG